MKYFSIAMVVIICLAIGGCTKPPAETMLFDFETDDELDRFAWRCHVLFSLSGDHVTNGKKSLRLELFPSEYPGLVPMDVPKNWSSYRAFCLDIYNPQHHDIPMTVRIDDRENNPDYPDRYNHKLNLMPGKNSVCLPCDSLITSGTKRKMSLKNIFLIDLFMTKPDKKIILYFDYFRLVR